MDKARIAAYVLASLIAAFIVNYFYVPKDSAKVFQGQQEESPNVMVRQKWE